MLQDILVPIFICVVLPVAMVWLTMRTRQNEANRKSEVMLKAIESGVNLDPELFKGAQAPVKTIKEKLLGRLTGASVVSLLGVVFLVSGIVLDGNENWGDLCKLTSVAGGILIAIGIALFVVYFVGKKMLAKEIEAEEKKLGGYQQ